MYISKCHSTPYIAYQNKPAVVTDLTREARMPLFHLDMILTDNGFFAVSFFAASCSPKQSSHHFPLPTRIQFITNLVRTKSQRIVSLSIATMKLSSYCSVFWLALLLAVYKVSGKNNLVSDYIESYRVLKQHEETATLLCRILLITILNEDGEEYDFYVCNPIVDNVPTDLEYRIEVSNEIQQLVALHGEVVVTLQDAVFDDSMEITYSTAIHMPDVSLSHTIRRKLALSTGRLKLLPILITDSSGLTPMYNSNDLYDLLFVGAGSVKQQYSACSFGKLSIEPTTVGVLQVRVDVSVSENDSNKLTNAAAVAALRQLPGITSLTDYADLLVFVTPKMPGFLAYATMQGARSVYNNQYAGYLGVIMHEIGYVLQVLTFFHSFDVLAYMNTSLTIISLRFDSHRHNLYVGHANEHGTYLDLTNYMGGMIGGYHTRQRFPLMAFNAYHHFKLGWFENRVVTVYPAPLRAPDLIRLAAFVDYDLTAPSDAVVVRIDNTTFLQYNRASKYNVDTYEYKDHVVIVQTSDGSNTELVSALSMNGNKLYEQESNGRLLSIELCRDDRSTNTARIPDYVTVSIGYGLTNCRAAFGEGGVLIYPDKNPRALVVEQVEDGNTSQQQNDVDVVTRGNSLDRERRHRRLRTWRVPRGDIY